MKSIDVHPLRTLNGHWAYCTFLGKPQENVIRASPMVGDTKFRRVAEIQLLECIRHDYVVVRVFEITVYVDDWLVRSWRKAIPRSSLERGTFLHSQK